MHAKDSRLVGVGFAHADGVNLAPHMLFAKVLYAHPPILLVVMPAAGLAMVRVLHAHAPCRARGVPGQARWCAPFCAQHGRGSSSLLASGRCGAHLTTLGWLPIPVGQSMVSTRDAARALHCCAAPRACVRRHTVSCMLQALARTGAYGTRCSTQHSDTCGAFAQLMRHSSSGPGTRGRLPSVSPPRA